MKKVAVVIPFYRADLTVNDNIALKQCFKVLSGHDIIALKPRSLILPAGAQQYPFKNVISFDDIFFASNKAYSNLMLSEQFYEAFLDYEFILIHQLDAFVFADQLDYWCRQPYDYIGAPWIRDRGYPDVVKAIKSHIRYYLDARYDIRDSHGEPTRYQYENKVGNGGFSLRRVAVFYNLCRQNDVNREQYLTLDEHHYAEDRFWSVEVNRKKQKLKIPGYKTGLRFSFEWAPGRALKLNRGRLPFGCHAWDKYPDFWRPVFKSLGYQIQCP